ncbi:MAG: type VI secretion system baseplate subunit TssF [Thermodesulfobacteriota bacterium]|nr:type VI secretion system baseplate subunit TssF [Thermodesulfobacteriota bacterium]
MLNRYYQEELNRLRELAAEFSKSHPALAPMLGGTSQDPDVERLLEGVAFMSGLLRTKLDDEFPEIIQGLIQLTFPHYLRPIPSATMMVFSPKPGLMEKFTVPAGTAVDSIPVEGTTCRFLTCNDVTIHPLAITNAVYEDKIGEPPQIRISFQLTGMTLADWQPDNLRLYFPGDYTAASNLFQLLLTRTSRLIFTPQTGGAPASVAPSNIRPAGFSHEESIIPFPGRSFPGYRFIQEYLYFPRKFLFMDIQGWTAWGNPGNGSRFDIVFELSQAPDMPPRVAPASFMLYAVPAVNIFEHDASPILLDHRQSEYRIIPGGEKAASMEVHSIQKVTGISQGTVKKTDYTPFEIFSDDEGQASVYHVRRKLSPITQRPEIYLSVGYSAGAEPPAVETLAIQLLCTNGNLTRSLQSGDIAVPTSTSPELCTFKNILPATPSIHPPLGMEMLWKFLSSLTLNLFTIADTKNFKELLHQYIFPEAQDQGRMAANEKRLEGIRSVQCKPGRRLDRGTLITGQEINLTVNSNNFSGPGDAFIFGNILDRFFSDYAAINTYTRLFMQDEFSGETFQWNARIGEKPLI